MTSYRVRAAALMATMLAAGCVSTQNAGPANAQFQARQGALSLVREDFESARASLVWVASRCEAGAEGPRAMLLLAAAELDPGNAAGSPRAAGELAEAYLQLPSTPSDGRIMARAIYRLAAQLGGLTPARDDEAAAYPPLASHFDRCGETASDDLVGPLPSLPSETVAAHLEALESQLAARAARIGELEAEIQRITELLTSSAPPQATHAAP